MSIIHSRAPYLRRVCLEGIDVNHPTHKVGAELSVGGGAGGRGDNGAS